MKILVVDDEMDVRDLFLQSFRKELKAGQITLMFALSGEEAIEILNSLNPMDIVLVLSDINMPGMSGFELVKIIKKDFSYLKVFMISAYNDTVNNEIVSQLGVEEFVAKPVNFETLKSKIFNYS